jgi:hypothetical protein
MKNNWVLESASSAVEINGLVRLENPEIKDRLDKILLSIWPQIKEHAAKTMLKLEPPEEPDIISGESNNLLRTLSFMLFDGEDPVCRTEIECYSDHWMIDNEFYLNLDESADIEIVHELLGNTRFSGNPPTLMIYKLDPVNHFQLLFNAGWGEDWAEYDVSFLIESIYLSIDIHEKMHNIVLAGIKDTSQAEEFLSTAYEVYESHT